MQNNSLPEVTFRVFNQKESLSWLVAKKDKLDVKWNSNGYGEKLTVKIMKACNLSFPNQILKGGIKVTVHKYSRKKHGSLRGSVDPREPARLSLFVNKEDTFKSLFSILVHELIHSLLWSRYYFDKRRRQISFLADAFADELLTTLLEEIVMKGNFREIDFEWALDYARDETCQKLKNLKRSRDDYEIVLKEIKLFFKGCRQAIRQGSDALKERDHALCEIASPMPSFKQKKGIRG